MAKWTGQWRIAGQNGQPNTVSVTDGDMTWDDVDEASYRLQCIKPPLEELPWYGGIKLQQPPSAPPVQPAASSAAPQDPSSDPLSYFATPGVLEARADVERQAAALIAKEFPGDQSIEVAANNIFEIVQHKAAVLTAESIADHYRILRNKR